MIPARISGWNRPAARPSMTTGGKPKPAGRSPRPASVWKVARHVRVPATAQYRVTTCGCSMTTVTCLAPTNRVPSSLLCPCRRAAVKRCGATTNATWRRTSPLIRATTIPATAAIWMTMASSISWGAPTMSSTFPGIGCPRGKWRIWSLVIRPWPSVRSLAYMMRSKGRCLWPWWCSRMVRASTRRPCRVTW
ncbi:hypothetical protein D3C79_801600 [compost metagenome]